MLVGVTYLDLVTRISYKRRGNGEREIWIERTKRYNCSSRSVGAATFVEMTNARDSPCRTDQTSQKGLEPLSSHVAVQLDYDPLALSAARPSSIRQVLLPTFAVLCQRILACIVPDVP